MLPEAVDIQGPTVGRWALRVSRIFTLGSSQAQGNSLRLGVNVFYRPIVLAVYQLN